jgi:hypothetical protein
LAEIIFAKTNIAPLAGGAACPARAICHGGMWARVSSKGICHGGTWAALFFAFFLQKSKRLADPSLY